MALQAKYTDPLQVVATERMRGEIQKIAERENVSQASVIRDILAGRRPPVKE